MSNLDGEIGILLEGVNYCLVSTQRLVAAQEAAGSSNSTSQQAIVALESLFGQINEQKSELRCSQITHCR